MMAGGAKFWQLHCRGPPAACPSGLIGGVEGLRHARNYSDTRSTFRINTEKSLNGIIVITDIIVVLCIA